MALLDDLAAEPTTWPMRCRTCIILTDLSQEERDAIQAALMDGTRDAPTVAKILTANGYPVSEHSTRRHKKQEHMV